MSVNATTFAVVAESKNEARSLVTFFPNEYASKLHTDELGSVPT